MLFKMSRFAPLVVTSVLVAHTSIAVPPAPLTNIQSIILPSEVLLRWDPAPGADYYRVYRGGPDKRWVPLTNHFQTPTFRDTDFTTLPSWYQIGAYNSAGESSFTGPFQVNGIPPQQMDGLRLDGVTVRPVSDTGVSIAWSLTTPTLVDGMIEIGESLDHLSTLVVSPALAWRHEFVITNLEPNRSYVYRLTSATAQRQGITHWNRFTTRPWVEPPPAVVHLPAGTSPSLSTDEDRPVHFTLAADSATGAPVTFSIEGVERGTIWGTPPDLIYRPRPEDSWPWDNFTVTYHDGITSNTSVVFVQIRPVNDAPIARDFSLTLPEDAWLAFSPQVSDNESLDTIYFIVSEPTNGVIRSTPAWFNERLRYEPRTNFFGIDHFTYAAFDPQATTGNVATVRIYVSSLSDDAPVAGQLSLIVTQGVGLTQFVLHGYDPDDAPNRYPPSTIFSILTPPQHGTATMFDPVSYDGSCRYQPAAGYAGTDRFTYRITDGLRFATGTVSILVINNNHRPVADSFTAFAEFGVALPIVLSGSDADGDALGFALLPLPEQRGTVSGTVPSLTYTPAAGFSGTDYVHFLANDGLENSMPAGVITIIVAPSNAPPTAPTALAATAISKSQINLSWKDNSGREKEFKIERMGEGQPWKEIGHVNANVTAYVDKAGLKPQKTYSYRLRASSKQGNSAYSNTTTIITPR